MYWSGGRCLLRSLSASPPRFARHALGYNLPSRFGSPITRRLPITRGLLSRRVLSCRFLWDRLLGYKALCFSRRRSHRSFLGFGSRCRPFPGALDGDRFLAFAYRRLRGDRRARFVYLGYKAAHLLPELAKRFRLPFALKACRS